MNDAPAWLKMPHLASRIFNTPIAIHPDKLRAILHAMAPRMGMSELTGDIYKVTHPAVVAHSAGSKPERPFEVIDGTAILPVFGTLVHRASWMNAMSGLTSYQELATEFDLALEASDVQRILLVIDSGGGEAAGLWDLGDKIFEARSVKPVLAVAQDFACSAAYLLGSAAESFFATQGAIVGSIGIVLSHMDVTDANRQAGILITEIHAGARKIDSSPDNPLSEDSRAALQTTVDDLFGLFVAKVAKYRGISEESIRATEADVFIGQNAVQLGLVDGIQSFEQILAADSSTVVTRITARGPGMKLKAGENLGSLLEDSITNQVTEERSRDDVIADLATAAEISTEEVEAAVSGEDQCPVIETLERFATVLELTVDQMIDAGEQDGCEYRADAEPPPETTEDEPAAAEDDEEKDKKKARTTRPGGAAPNKGGPMGTHVRGRAALVADRDKARAQRDAALASLAEVEDQRKAEIVSKFQAQGRITPSMLGTEKKPGPIRKLMEHTSVDELEAQLAAFPVLAHIEAGEPVDADLEALEITAEEQDIFSQLRITPETYRKYGQIRGINTDGTCKLADGSIVALPGGRA